MSNHLKSKLAQLKELHGLGLITDEEHAEQKRTLLAAELGSTPASSAAAALSGSTRVEGTPAAPSDVLGGGTLVHPSPSLSAGASLQGATATDSPEGLPARLGSYRVLGVVGAGGMGTVVRARHDSEGWARRQGGDVAVKLIHPHIAADPSFRERFFDEAELGKRTQHPGLARVYDVVMEGPWLGTILEYIEGDELSAWVRPGGLKVEDVVKLLAPLADALDYLHEQGIVHRDLKPANVKVRPDGRPVLLDLGIAKDLSAKSTSQTKTMTTMGTSAWMAPEQADAKSVTAAADVYALGLVAYALLSGRLPWEESASELRVLTNKMVGQLIPLASVAPDLPEGAAATVMEALSVKPSERPSSCSVLVEGLSAPAVELPVRTETQASMEERSVSKPPHRSSGENRPVEGRSALGPRSSVPPSGLGSGPSTVPKQGRPSETGARSKAGEGTSASVESVGWSADGETSAQSDGGSRVIIAVVATALIGVGLLWVSSGEDDKKVTAVTRYSETSPPPSSSTSRSGNEVKRDAPSPSPSPSPSSRVVRSEPDYSPPPAGTTGYTIQLGSWTSKQDAKGHASRLVSIGAQPHIQQAIVKGTVYYRVRVGVYSSRQAAVKAAPRFAAYTKEAGEDPWVTTVP